MPWNSAMWDIQIAQMEGEREKEHMEAKAREARNKK